MDEMNPTPQDLPPPEKHHFLPRLFAVLSGAAAGILTGMKIRDWSLHDFVRRGRTLPGAEDSYVLKAERIVNEKFAAPLAEARQKFLETVGQLQTKHQAALTAAHSITNPDKMAREIENAGNNFSYLRQLAMEKMDHVLHSKIIQEMQAGLRHSRHKTQIYAFGAVAAVTVGAVVYYAANRLLNGSDSHKERIAERREAATPQEAHI